MLQAISNLKRFRDDPLLFTEQLESLGSVVSAYFGPKCFHFVYDVEAAEQVLLKNHTNYIKSRLIFNQIIPITGKRGIVQLEGEEWARLRSKTGEMFTKQAFLAYPSIIEHYLSLCIRELEEACDKNKPIDMSSLFINYTIRSAVKIFLDCRDDEAAAKIAADFIELNHRCGMRMRNLFNLPLIIKTENNRAIDNLSKALRRRLGLLIIDAWHRRENKGLIGNLTPMFTEMNDNAIAFITDQLLTFLFAGFETTSASLTFCFYLLSKNPRAQDLIRKEIKDIGQKEVLNIDSIKSYSYAMATYKEALRLFPPAWIVAREAIGDDIIGTHRVRKKENIVICIRQIHRNEKLWTLARDFIPERFLSTGDRPKKCAFMPFGVGSRICSGAQLAMLEGVNAIVALCKRFTFFVDDTDLSLKALVTLNPKIPVIVKVKRI